MSFKHVLQLRLFQVQGVFFQKHLLYFLDPLNMLLCNEALVIDAMNQFLRNPSSPVNRYISLHHHHSHSLYSWSGPWCVLHCVGLGSEFQHCCQYYRILNIFFIQQLGFSTGKSLTNANNISKISFFLDTLTPLNSGLISSSPINEISRRWQDNAAFLADGTGFYNVQVPDTIHGMSGIQHVLVLCIWQI